VTRTPDSLGRTYLLRPGTLSPRRRLARFASVRSLAGLADGPLGAVFPAAVMNPCWQRLRELLWLAVLVSRTF